MEDFVLQTFFTSLLGYLSYQRYHIGYSGGAYVGGAFAGYVVELRHLVEASVDSFKWWYVK